MPKELAGDSCISFSALSHVEHWSFAGPKPERVTVTSHERHTADAAIPPASLKLYITWMLFMTPQAGLASARRAHPRTVRAGGDVAFHSPHREDRLPQAKVRRFRALPRRGFGRD